MRPQSFCFWLTAQMVVLSVATIMAAGAAPARQPTIQVAIEQAQQLLEQDFDFEAAVGTLDTVVDALTSSQNAEPELLVLAYELRGRAHFNLDDSAAATDDFERLVQLRADHLLSDRLSPRIVEFFESVRQRLVGTLLLELPQPAVLTIDDRIYQVGRQAAIDLLVGTHELVIQRPGFSEVLEEFSITAREFTQLVPVSERISATRSVITRPSGVRVIVDDVLWGVTEPNPSSRGESLPLIVDELMPGQHSLRLERECFEPIATAFGVADVPGDRTETIELIPAVAVVTVETNSRDATIYVDGEPQGLAPTRLVNLCEGPHVIEVRATEGRFVDRRVWAAGTEVTLEAELRPVFEIVEVFGSGDVAQITEVAGRVEEALGASRGLLVVATTATQLEAVAGEPQLRVALSDSNTTTNRRRDLARAWSDRLNAQGVAWLVPVDAVSDLYDLFLLARDSGVPDVLRLELGDIGSRIAAIRRLEAPLPPLSRTTLQTLVIDVANLEGAAVVHADVDGVGVEAGLRPGDLIIGVSGGVVRSAADLSSVVSAGDPSVPLTLELRGDNGVTRSTTILPALEADTVPLEDDRLLYNKMLLDLQALERVADSRLTRSSAQLSLSIVYMRLERWDLALRALAEVRLPEGAGVSATAVDYLMGLCLTEIGQLDDARARLRRAVDAGQGMLAIGGPRVGPLAQRALERLPQ